uniref:cyclin-dependent kinase 4 inhibitor C n=1 Tax=Gasterosteus aculeatus aculeatus TaxID=481459 RepID=UPI001A9962B2|nr:cyclin-dependent kinase 4 inhibitor C [Gasterosteus aculeatus aculeatus]
MHPFCLAQHIHRPRSIRTTKKICSIFFTRMSDLLCKASAKGNLHSVLFLLQNGASVNGFNKYNRTALQVVQLGSTAVIEALLRAGADPNLRDPVLGLTVMHDAAREGFADSVRVLLAYGADPNLVDDTGNLPLHLAATEGHLEATRQLIAATADPRAPNGLGHSAGQEARIHKRVETAQYIEDYLGTD